MTFISAVSSAASPETMIFIIVLTTLFLYAESNFQVNQTAELTFLQGQQAEISCTHNISAYNRIFWYKTHTDLGPEHVISGYNFAEDNGPFSMTFNKDKLSTTLIIRDVQTPHAGTYYCAVSDNALSPHYVGHTELHYI
ncbi:hypothetical protein FKM82_026768 [Ascaphus truei]